MRLIFCLRYSHFTLTYPRSKVPEQLGHAIDGCILELLVVTQTQKYVYSHTFSGVIWCMLCFCGVICNTPTFDARDLGSTSINTALIRKQSSLPVPSEDFHPLSPSEDNRCCSSSEDNHPLYRKTVFYSPLSIERQSSPLSIGRRSSPLSIGRRSFHCSFPLFQQCWFSSLSMLSEVRRRKLRYGGES